MVLNTTGVNVVQITDAAFKLHNQTIDQLQTELAVTKAKYTKLLEERDEQHALEVKKLQSTISSLQSQIDTLTLTNKDLATKLDTTVQAVKRLQATETRRHYRMLCGAIAFNLVECIVMRVWNDKRLLKQLRTYDDMKKHPKNPQQAQVWQAIEKEWTDELEDAFTELRDCRTNDAHPTRVNPDTDVDVPTPDQLKKVVAEVFNARKQKETRESAYQLIDLLDKLALVLKRDILE